jgi:hypothetical protein
VGRGGLRQSAAEENETMSETQNVTQVAKAMTLAADAINGSLSKGGTYSIDASYIRSYGADVDAVCDTLRERCEDFTSRFDSGSGVAEYKGTDPYGDEWSVHVRTRN